MTITRKDQNPASIGEEQDPRRSGGRNLYSHTDEIRSTPENT